MKPETQPQSKEILPRSATLDVVTVNQVLVAQIELAIADDGMRPDRARGTADLRLRLQSKAAMFLPAFGRRVDQDHRATALVEAIEHAVGTSDRALAQFA